MIHLLASMLIAAAPGRVLVYSFTVGINDRTVDSAAGEHGDVHRNEVSDLGTITVTVVGLDPGGGLVVNVAESARTNRSVAPATCIIFSNTNVMCGSSVVTPEETSILRPLNPKFVDPTTLDAKGHWHIAPGSGVSIDYTVSQNAGGFAITGTRDESSPQGTVHSEMTYTYDAAKVVTTHVHEYQTVREQSGAVNALTTIEVQGTLTSDSLSSKA
ncbi:MAG: hypothetical protein WBD74_03985 [Candidatus Aquilonibacter sp.]